MMNQTIRYIKKYIIFLLNFKYIKPLVTLLITAVLVALMFLIRPHPKTSHPQEKAWIVQTEYLKLENATPTATLFGKIESRFHSQLEAASNAYVQAVLVREGQLVNKDTILIQLNPQDAQLAVDKQQARLKELAASITAENERHANDLRALKLSKKLVQLSENALTRQKKLTDKKLASIADLEVKEAALREQKLKLYQRELNIETYDDKIAALESQQKAVKADLETAQLELNRTTIKAPFDGRISAVHVSTGDRVNANEMVIAIYDEQQLEARAQIPDQYIPHINHALKKQIKLHATASINGENLQLYLDRLAGKIATGRGGIDGLFIISGNHQTLALGRTIKLQMELETVDDVYKIPYTALYGNNKIYKVTNNRMKPIIVQRYGQTISPNGTVYLLIKNKELSPGTEIVSTHLPNAIDGLLIKRVDK